ncbi:MAG TPA: hypothetical protein VF706_04970 [Solirubrobacteraceae bacterium]
MSAITKHENAKPATGLAEQSSNALRPVRSQARGLSPAGTLLLVLLAGALSLAALPDSTLHALNAAGAFKGTPIDGVQNFVEKLKGNVVWLGGTSMGLVIAVVGIMFMTGHSRAHDLAIRTIAGLMILAAISGIVA